VRAVSQFAAGFGFPWKDMAGRAVAPLCSHRLSRACCFS